MPMFFALFQAAATTNGEPVFSLGNVITLVVVILTGAGIVLRGEGKLRALGELVDRHIREDYKQFEIFAAHIMDDDKHIGRRLYEELMKRFDRAELDRERLERKIDTVVRQTKT